MVSSTQRGAQLPEEQRGVYTSWVGLYYVEEDASQVFSDEKYVMWKDLLVCLIILIGAGDSFGGGDDDEEGGSP